MRSLPLILDKIVSRVDGNRYLGRTGFLLLVLVLGAAAVVAGYSGVVDDAGLIIDGSVFGDEKSNGTVQVPAGAVAAGNRSVTIGSEENDICVGECEDVSGGGK